MQLYPRIVAHLLVISVKIPVNLLVKLAKLEELPHQKCSALRGGLDSSTPQSFWSPLDGSVEKPRFSTVYLHRVLAFSLW